MFLFTSTRGRHMAIPWCEPIVCPDEFCFGICAISAFLRNTRTTVRTYVQRNWLWIFLLNSCSRLVIFHHRSIRSPDKEIVFVLTYSFWLVNEKGHFRGCRETKDTIRTKLFDSVCPYICKSVIGWKKSQPKRNKAHIYVGTVCFISAFPLSHHTCDGLVEKPIYSKSV